MTNWLETYRNAGIAMDRVLMNHRSAERTAVVNAAILSKIGWKTTDDVLDVGCGDGSLLAALPPVHRRVGVLPSREEVTAFSAIHQGSGIEITEGTSGQLPFPSRQFDVILCNGVLLILDASIVQKTLREFYRVARPGAVVFLGETPRPVLLEERLRSWLRRGRTRNLSGLLALHPAALTKMCRAAGFTDVRATPSVVRYRFDCLMRKGDHDPQIRPLHPF